jgi:quercetin dioxygenase-like cupin family protein
VEVTGAVKIVDVERLEWQGVPDSWAGKVARGEPSVRFKPFATGTPAIPAGQLIEFEPGHVEAPHSHDEGEIFYILGGDLTIGGERIEPGMLVSIDAGIVYGPLETTAGCRFLRLGLAKT